MGQSQKEQVELVVLEKLEYKEDSVNHHRAFKPGIDYSIKVLRGLKELYIEKKPYIAMIFIQFLYAGTSLLSKAAVTEGMNSYIFVVYRQAFATIALAPFADFVESGVSCYSFLNLQEELCSFVLYPDLQDILDFFMRDQRELESLLLCPELCDCHICYLIHQHNPCHCSRHCCFPKGFLIKQYPAKLRLTTLQIFFSCILSAVWATSNERSIAAWKLGWNVNLLSVLYCGVIATAITYWLQIWVVEIKGPVFTAMFSPLALLITAVFSALLFKETLHWGSACGILFLVVGLYGVLWGKHKEENKETYEREVAAKVSDH